jgi:HEPN domain-containing protein
MNPHELRVREAQAWLAKAVDDLECAKLLGAAGHDANALYHSQQTVEKALKAFLTWHDKPFRKTHNLMELGGACAAVDPSINSTTVSVHALSDYAWKLRYPGDPYVLEDGELSSMIQLASSALKAIQDRLSVNEFPDPTSAEPE